MFIRIYTGLLLSICVAVLCCYLILSAANQIRLTQHTQQIFSGTFHLITEGLSRHQGEKRTQWLTVVSRLIGVPLKLLPLSDAHFTHDQLSDLESHELLIEIDDNRTHIYQRLSTSPDQATQKQQVLQAEFEDISEQQIRIAAFLALNELGRFKGNEQEKQLARLQSLFEFPIHVMPIDQTRLDQQQQKRIGRGDVVVTFGHNEQTRDVLFAYAPFNEQGDILVLGPIPVFDPTPMPLILLLIAVTIFITATVAYLMVRHVEKRLQRVDQALDTFGLGDMHTRVELEGKDSVARLGITVNSMADRISELIQAQKRLTQAVSHEIRTPVSRLKFRLEMLKSAENDQDRENRIEGMNRDIQELDQLVDEILTHQKLDQANIPLAMHPHNLVNIARECLQAHSELQADVQTVFNHDDLTAPYLCDAGLMKRLMNNLISNAFKHCSQQVRISLFKHTSYILIRIEDDGEGIPSKDLESVFSPFTRLDSSRNKKTGGYGLGLAIARHIAQAHEGTLTANRSELGGALLELHLPLPGSNTSTKGVQP